jgi:ribosomal protein S3AE
MELTEALLKRRLERQKARQEIDTENTTLLNTRHYLYTEPRVTDSEREALKMIFRKTISNGSHLYRCKDVEQAGRFQDFLMRHLPLNFASGVIRDCEINTFSS